MPNNPKAKDNLKLFEPGEKWKGNRHGRIVKPDSLAGEWKKIWSEILFDDKGQPIIDEVTGKALTRLTARMRAATTSRNTKEFEIALDRSYGKVKEQLDVTSNGESLVEKYTPEQVADKLSALLETIKARESK